MVQVNGHCLMCGMCCRLSTSILSEDQWTPETEELLILKGKQYVDTIDGQRRYVGIGVCPHLNLITNKCGIQEHKPQFCKDYPRDKLDILPGCGYSL